MEELMDYVHRQQFKQRFLLMCGLFSIVFNAVPGTILIAAAVLGKWNKKVQYAAAAACFTAMITGIITAIVAPPLYYLNLFLEEPFKWMFYGPGFRLIWSGFWAFWPSLYAPRYLCTADQFISEYEAKKEDEYIVESEAEEVLDIPGHVLIAGETGMGKSTLFSKYIKKSIEDNDNLLIISGKSALNDPTSLLNQLKKLAEEKDREVVVFSMNKNAERYIYNPLSAMTPSIIADTLSNMTDYDTASAHYKNNLEIVIIIITSLLECASIPVSFPALSRFFNYDLCLSFAEELNSDGLCPDSLLEKVEFNKDAFNETKGSFPRINKMLLGDTESFFQIMENDSREVSNVYKAFSEKKIVFFDLDFGSYEDTADAIGRIVLSDIKNTINKVEFGKYRLIFDEAGKYAGNGRALESIYSMARSKGFQALSAIQNFEQTSPELIQTLCNNSRSYCFFRLSGENAEKVASLFGTRPDVETTYKSDTALVDEQGSKKSILRFKIKIDYIKELPELTCFFYNKSEPDKVRKIKLRHDDNKPE